MDLNYKLFGEGEPLIILHGLYGASDNWVGIARELQEYFQVVLVDLRNHGKSPHNENHNYDVMADDVLQLMNKLQIYSCNIMGHSMGGKVAMAIALYSPERIRRLLIVDISLRQYKDSEGDLQFKEHRNILNALLNVNLTQMQSRREVDELLVKSIPSAKVRAFLLKNLFRTKEKEFAWKINLPVLLTNLESISQGFEDRKKEFMQIKQPVLFIKGAESQYIQQKDIDLIAESFVNYELEVISGASHWVHAEKPKEFLDAVKNFCL